MACTFNPPIRPVKMDIGYWIPNIQTRKSRIIGYPKPDFSGIGSGSGSENFGLSGIGLPDIRSGIPELSDLSDLFSKINKLYFYYN